MRRPTVRRQQPGVALFPFLAVLICTMGSLIVLLVLVVQGARAGTASAASAVVEPTPAIDPEELKRLTEAEEDLTWRANMLAEQKTQYADDLAKKRLELAHLEDHIRRLEDEAHRLQAQVEELMQSEKAGFADEAGAQQQLAEMRSEIDAKKDQLDKARKEVMRRRPAYAIVPYDGPNGTSRRPMYIECSEKGIILQPEGVKLSALDFEGPLGPGNPLDAALRAIREHWKRNGLQGEPYPLIIVRPDGAVAFGAARAAMKHWESEFGYELVDQDAELKYPPTDPSLATTLERAVSDARSRQQMLASAMPSRFGAEAKLTSFRAADHVNYEQFADDGGAPGGMSGGTGRPGGLPSTSLSGNGMGAGPRGATGSGGSGTSGQGAYDGSSATAGNGRGMNGGTAATSASFSAPGANGQGGQYASGANARTAGPPGTYGGNAAQGSTTPGGGSSTADGSPTGRYAAGNNSAQGSASGSSVPGGVAGGSAAKGSTSASGNSSGSGGSSSSGDASQQAGASPSLNVNMGSPPVSAQKQKARKAIRSRGENWALPVSSSKATAVKRPIRVVCGPDQLVLLPEAGDSRTPLLVPCPDGLAPNLDGFLETVWRHMDRWGLAVSGGYWKPVLTVDVQPGGDERFEELQVLLRGSGIEVERKPSSN
jgi:hypothetical protein